MRRTNKKGFTIVELVIVIAVIAILAAVLIPTFASLVNKANQSADIQAVRQMNTILATYTDGSIKTVSDAVKVLDGENIDLENYKPLAKDHYFYFVDNNGTPTIIYTDEKDAIVYPEVSDSITKYQWMSLSGDVPTDDNYKIENGAVTIDSGAKLAHLIEAKKNTAEELTITLSGNVDLRGAAVDFGKTSANITIKGESADKTTLSGLRADDNTVSPTSGEFAGHSYGYGLFGDITSGTVTIENVTISGLNVGNSLATHEKGANTIGLIAGYIQSGATVKLSNVIFKDCVVNGYQKVGAIVGQLRGTLGMENVKFVNTTVSGSIEVAKIAGITYGNLSVSDDCDVSGITIKGLGDTFTNTAFTVSLDGFTWKGDSANTFVYHGGHQNAKEDGVFNVATNDWTWYLLTQENAAWDYTARAKGAANYNGKSCFLNGTAFSASTNFTNGKPVDTTSTGTN